MVPGEILERLRCPQCGAPVRDAEGGIRCRTGHGIRMPDGYIDLSSEPLDPNTAGMYRSFGYQHTVFDTLTPEDAHVWRRYFSDVPFEQLEGGVGLDAGCGNGRFAAYLAERLRALVALDGSIA